MIGNFNEEAQQILVNAKNEMINLKHPYIGTEHLVLSLLHKNIEISEKYGNERYRFRYDSAG